MAGDNIPVIASINHSSSIASVKIALVNKDAIPLSSPKYFFPESNSFDLSYNYYLDTTLATANYLFLVSASDGEGNTSKIYTPVSVAGEEEEFEQVIAVCSPNTLHSSLYSIDVEGGYEHLIDLDYNVISSDISSVHQQLYLIKEHSVGMDAYNLERWEVDFTVLGPEVISVYTGHEPELAYVSYWNMGIKGYDNTGYTAFVTQQNQTDTVVKWCRKHNDKVLAYCYYNGPGAKRFIWQYWAETGVYRASLYIDFEAKDFFPLSQDVSLVFGNDIATGHVSTFDVTLNKITWKKTLTDGLIFRVVRTSENVFLLATPQAIYRYDHSQQTLTAWVSGVFAHSMVYDEVRQVVYASNRGYRKLYAFSYPDATILQEVTLPYDIEDIHLHYK